MTLNAEAVADRLRDDRTEYVDDIHLNDDAECLLRALLAIARRIDQPLITCQAVRDYHDALDELCDWRKEHDA